MRWLRSPEPTSVRRSSARRSMLLLPLQFIEPRFQHPQGFGEILVLALFILALHDQARFVMRQPDGGGGFVHVLPAGAAGAENVLAIIVRLDVDFDIFRLGQHGDGGGGGVNAALWLRSAGTRWTRCPPLSYCRSAKQLSPSMPRTISLKPPNSVALISSTSIFQPRAFAIVAIHFVEIAGEQGRFVAAGAAANFHHAAVAIGVFAAGRQVEQFVPILFAFGAKLRQLGLGQLAHVGVVALDHFLRFGDLRRSVA